MKLALANNKNVFCISYIILINSEKFSNPFPDCTLPRKIN